jgi:hypothetical protein
MYLLDRAYNMVWKVAFTPQRFSVLHSAHRATLSAKLVKGWAERSSIALVAVCLLCAFPMTLYLCMENTMA